MEIVDTVNVKRLLNVKKTLNDQFQQKRMPNCNISSKGIILTKITNSIFVYRNCINEFNSIMIIVGFIVSNHKPQLIKTGRWNNVSEYQRHCT